MAKNTVELLDAKEFAQRLETSAAKRILLDVRTPREWKNDGRLANAVLIPIQEIEGRVNELPRDAEILVYCAHGNRSRSVANWLIQLGYPSVSDMVGGIELWMRAGLPVERG
jgi:rhodanese-related sulfurtransferase